MFNFIIKVLFILSFHTALNAATGGGGSPGSGTQQAERREEKLLGSKGNRSETNQGDTNRPDNNRPKRESDQAASCTWYQYDWKEGDKFRKWCSDKRDGNFVEVAAIPTESQKQEWEAKWALARRLKSGNPLNQEDRRYKVRNEESIKKTTSADRVYCLHTGMGSFGRHDGKVGYQNKCLFDIFIKCSDQSEMLRLPSAPGDFGIALFCKNPVVK